MGYPRSPAMSPFDTARTISYSTLIETMRLLYRFRVITSYLSKVAYVNLAHLHLATRWVTPFEFRRYL